MLLIYGSNYFELLFFAETVELNEVFWFIVSETVYEKWRNHICIGLQLIELFCSISVVNLILVWVEFMKYPKFYNCHLDDTYFNGTVRQLQSVEHFIIDIWLLYFSQTFSYRCDNSLYFGTPVPTKNNSI